MYQISLKLLYKSSPNCRYQPPKFPLEQWKNENCLWLCLRPKRNFQNSSPKSFVKSCIATLHATNKLARFVCYQLCNAHYRQFQSLSCGYTTSTPHYHYASSTLHCSLWFSPQKQICPFLLGNNRNLENIILMPTWPNTQNSIIISFSCTNTTHHCFKNTP